jgi:serine/threonine-protein kinase RsbW
VSTQPSANACQTYEVPAEYSPPGVSAGIRTLDKLTVAAVFSGSRDQVRHARRLAAHVLDGWPAADDVLLCVSELTANAVVHSASGAPGGFFWLHLTAVPDDFIRIEVCDQGDQWIDREHDGERPHGLDIVRSLAADFGVDGDARSGRIAWARLDLSGRAADPPTLGAALGSALAIDDPARPAVNSSAAARDEGCPWPS